MKNLRTLITMLLAFVLVLALAISCAKKEEPPAEETMTPATEQPMTTDSTMMSTDTTMTQPAESTPQ
jgi:uncharacterized lipoprotein YehR (DUF1307 family)